MRRRWQMARHALAETNPIDALQSGIHNEHQAAASTTSQLRQGNRQARWPEQPRRDVGIDPLRPQRRRAPC